MFTFRGREAELSYLQRIYDEERFRTCVIHGRRRIGKTTLLERFCEDKRNVYVQFVRGTERDNLCSCAVALSLLASGRAPGSFMEFLGILKEICSEERTVIVFDEYTYLSEMGPVYSSALQHFADWLVKNSDSMLIICGSSASMILNEVDNERNPLFGRFYHRLELKPMSLEECREFHPGMCGEDLLRLYLTVGGVPSYHEITNLPTYRENVEEKLLCGTAMENEVFAYLGELGDVGRYSPILSSLADGVRTVRGMSERTGIPESTIRDHVSRLVGLGIVSKLNMLPVSRGRPEYYISDYLVSFHYDVLVRYRSLFSSRRGVSRFDSVKSQIDTHLGRVFEHYCRELITGAYSCTEVGTWWGKVPVFDDDGRPEKDVNGQVVCEDVDVDVIAVVRNGVNRIDLFGECKFRNRQMGLPDYRTLQERVSRISRGSNRRLVLFSLGGFTEELRDIADSESVLLFDREQLCEGSKPPEIQ